MTYFFDQITFYRLILFLTNILLLFIAISAFIDINPVRSVLRLIGCYILASLLLVGFHLPYLAFLFIMIYIGAVSVLFLFVVMLVKPIAYTQPVFSFKIICAICLSFIVVGSLSDIFHLFLTYSIEGLFGHNLDLREKYIFLFSENSKQFLIDISFKSYFENILFNISKQLFIFQGLNLLIIGLILFIALVISISLTTSYNQNLLALQANNAAKTRNI